MTMKNMTKHQQVFYLIGWASCIQSLAMGGFLAWRTWRDHQAELRHQRIQDEAKTSWPRPTFYRVGDVRNSPTDEVEGL